MLNEISQEKINTLCYHLYVKSKNTVNPSEQNNKEADSQMQRTNQWLWETGACGVQEWKSTNYCVEEEFKDIFCNMGNIDNIL